MEFGPPFSLVVYALAAGVYLGAYTVYGMMGFGAGVLATPILVHVLPLRFVVPLAALHEFILALILGRRAARSVVVGEYFAIVVPMLIGMAVGLALLIHLPERPAMLILGAVVAANALWALLGRGGHGSIARGWAIPFGFAGGVLGGAFGFGGPLYVIYLARRIHDKAALRSTMGALIFTSGCVRLVLFATSGLLAQDDLWSGMVWLLPFVIGGGLLGTHLHLRFTPERARLGLNLLLLATGGSLVIRALSSSLP